MPAWRCRCVVRHSRASLQSDVIPPHTLQHTIFQSLPKTPHVGVRGVAKLLLPVVPPAASPARPASPSSPHVIPSPKGIEPLEHTASHELASPGQGAAAVVLPESKRRASTRPSSRPNRNRASSPKLSAAHAHSILHTCLIRGPASDLQPPLSNASAAESGAGVEQGRLSRSPFRGFEPPSMSANAMQVCASCLWPASRRLLQINPF
jgi:hypothetical protein